MWGWGVVPIWVGVSWYSCSSKGLRTDLEEHPLSRAGLELSDWEYETGVVGSEG